MLRLAPLLFALVLVPGAAAAQERPASMVFCYEDQDSYPWVMRDRSGLNIRLIKLVERELAVPVQLVPLPWRRCLAELASNRVDGAFAASFKSERLEMGHYPLGADGKPDPSLRLHVSSYSLYRRKGDDLGWDGSRFTNLRGSVGILSGFSIGEILRDMQVQVDEGSKSPEDTLRKLVAGRVQGVALQTPRVEHLLSRNPELARQIERHPVALEEKPYYLMLSFRMLREHPKFSAALWQQLARSRESAEYRRIEQEFYASN